MVRRTIGLAAVLGLVALPSSRAEAGVLTTFQDAMQAGSPAPGWSYLWNSGGPIGNPSNYTSMVATTDPYILYDTTGSPVLPNPAPGAYDYLGLIDPKYPDLSGFFNRPGGSPGLGSSDSGSGGIERYAIAAYTLPVGGETMVTSGMLINADASADGIDLNVYVDSNPLPLFQATTISGTKGATLPFAVDLGTLSAGDTIYVAIGGHLTDVRDSFVLEYDISSSAIPEPSAIVLAMTSITMVVHYWRRRLITAA